MEADSRQPWDFSPVAIGGVGGSGTRLIAETLAKLGFYIGSDLNKANDNLWFTLLFKRAELLALDDNQEQLNEAATVFLNAMVTRRPLSRDQRALLEVLASADRLQHKATWLRARVETLSNVTEHKPPLGRERWGWKEPNTHVFLNYLKDALPNMKYIHVMRNGLDMAHSSNQNQLKLWGHFFLGIGDFEVNPYYSLKYWCRVHNRILDIGEQMGGRFLLLNYDDYCSNPKEGLQCLLSFLGVENVSLQERTLYEEVRPPDSIGRFKHHGLHIFDPGDTKFVSNLGFDTSVF